MGFGPWRVSKWLDNGPFWDPKGVKAGSKMRFSQSDCGRFGILKQVFLARFEPLLTWFGPWKVPKCLENGPFWDPKAVTIGSKPHFSKSDPRPFGMLKQVGTKKGSKVGHKCVVPKVVLDHLASPKTPCKWAVLGPNGRQKWVKKAFFKIYP